MKRALLAQDSFLRFIASIEGVETMDETVFFSEDNCIMESVCESQVKKICRISEIMEFC